MALKKKINKNEYEKLNESFKELYVEDGDNFILDLEGEEDLGALKRAKEHEAAKRKEAAKLAKELKDELESLKAEKDEEISKLKNKLTNVFVDSAAKKIAEEICTVPSLLAPILKNRLSVDLDSDIPVTRVLDENGEISPLTLEELQKEFSSNAEYSAIMIASKASGGAKPTPPTQAPPAGSGASTDLLTNSAALKAHIQSKIESKAGE